jgi:hypothetical protein
MQLEVYILLDTHDWSFNCVVNFCDKMFHLFVDLRRCALSCQYLETISEKLRHDVRVYWKCLVYVYMLRLM